MSGQLAEALKEKKGDRSLRALARDLNVAVGTAEGWLNGWRSPKLYHLRPLGEYINESASTIMDWEIDAIEARGVYLRSECVEDGDCLNYVDNKGECARVDHCPLVLDSVA